jgi:hypothetical protein
MEARAKPGSMLRHYKRKKPVTLKSYRLLKWGAALLRP